MTPRHEVAGYREYAPPEAIAAFVEALWIHQTPHEPLPAGAAHRVLPEMAVSLAFQGRRDDDGAPSDWSPLLVGPKLHAQIYELVPGRELAAIRIKPEWVGPLLGVDPMDVEDRVVDLAAVLPALADRLHARLSRTRSAVDAVRVLASTLVELRAGATAPPSAGAARALDLVRRSGGTVACGRVAASLGLSDRHVRRQVVDSTGVSPKTYARALRLVRAMLRADRAERPAWADIAAATGYCDQSHLIRDCCAMTGLSPRDLHAERRRQIVHEPMSAFSNRG